VVDVRALRACVRARAPTTSHTSVRRWTYFVLPTLVPMLVSTNFGTQHLDNWALVR